MIAKENVILRSACACDIEKILELEKKAFPFDAWTKELFEAYLCNSDSSSVIFIVAENNKKLIGYVCLHIILDEAEIENLAVDCNFKRSGIASMLLEYIITKVQNLDVKHMYLEVHIDNIPAIELYKKFGFEALRTRKNYYPYGDAFELKRTL
ncbi:MAG: ribosomal protein S18-alanine N-acetyltransferase [Firmicutes bacterium]|nr:ribosomal protein S18-alanine N-acetyltransferase [Bacillota bacterium]